MKKEILDFIRRRFQTDCNWLNGNCYYFALILKSRFPEGKIIYEVIDGHFTFYCDGCYFDFSGQVFPTGYLVEWDKFDQYDSNQKQRIIMDCIM